MIFVLILFAMMLMSSLADEIAPQFALLGMETGKNRVKLTDLLSI